MSKTPISPLRARMIEDMNVRKFNDKTQNDYIRHVKTFSTFLGRSLVKATPEDLRRFQVYQIRAGGQPQNINSTIPAMRVVFMVTLCGPEMCQDLTLVPQSQKLPTVLSNTELQVKQRLNAAGRHNPRIPDDTIAAHARAGSTDAGSPDRAPAQSDRC